MKAPTIKEIDKNRQQGFRPVVGCITNDEDKILLLFKKEHNLWQLPQGGIENKEPFSAALKREMAEELGEEFANKLVAQKPLLIHINEVEFPPHTQGSRELSTDEGEGLTMKGKKYFFCHLRHKEGEAPNLAKTEFDDFVWAPYSVAKFLASTIYQRGKKRITLGVLDVLKEIGKIA